MTVPFVVLRLLCAGPSHGYLLQKRLSDYRHYYPLSNVNIYPVLQQLEAQGYACSSTQIERSRARKTYRITEEGRAAFERWMRECPEDTFAFQNDPVALKLMLASDGEVDWLGDAIAGLGGVIEESKADLEKLDGRGTPLERLTLEWRLAAYEKRRHFLEQALEIVREDSRTARG